MRPLHDRPKGTSKPPRTPRKRESLIGNEMHGRASTTALEPATYIGDYAFDTETARELKSQECRDRETLLM